MKLSYLIFIVITLFSSAVFSAEEEEAEASSDENSEEVATKPDDNDSTRMLRQTQDIKGYQPITVAGQSITATYLEETLGERHGVIILLHDQGEQLESKGVVTPLRHTLPEHGWSTLTLSLDYPSTPNILLSESASTSETDNEASTEEGDEDNAEEESVKEETKQEVDTQPEEAGTAKLTDEEKKTLPPISNQQRLEATIQFLLAKDIKRIVFLGHGEGGNLAIEMLDKITTPISALVLVGATALPEKEIFKEFNFPVLDLYGAQDLAAVPDAVKYRKLAMKRLGNTRYETRQVVGADHFFTGLDATLEVIVSGWLWKKFIKQEDN